MAVTVTVSIVGGLVDDVAGALLPGVGSARAEAARQELVLFEAASLKEAFARIAERFEMENAGVKIIPNAAGSQELSAQIQHGASADIFASADRKHMDALISQGLASSPESFICNTPVIVVRLDPRLQIRALGDLPRAERIVVGAPEVPIGAYTLQILQKAAAKYGADFPKRVDAKIVSRELNVRQVLAKVVLGEADAAIVYRSDALAAKKQVRVVEIPANLNVTAEYAMAVLKAAPHRELGRRWMALVKSPFGVTVLREAGFVPCPSR